MARGALFSEFEMAAPPRHALIVLTDHLGDMLLALPAVQVLKGAFPECRFTGLASAAKAEAGGHHPDADAIIIDPSKAKGSRLRDEAPCHIPGPCCVPVFDQRTPIPADQLRSKSASRSLRAREPAARADSAGVASRHAPGPKSISNAIGVQTRAANEHGSWTVRIVATSPQSAHRSARKPPPANHSFSCLARRFSHTSESNVRSRSRQMRTRAALRFDAGCKTRGVRYRPPQHGRQARFLPLHPRKARPRPPQPPHQKQPRTLQHTRSSPGRRATPRVTSTSNLQIKGAARQCQLLRQSATTFL